MSTKSAIDILNDLGLWAYSPDFAGFESSGALRDLGNPVSVVVLISNFDTQIDINGIVDFLGNSSGLFARETVDALKLVNCRSDAEVLSRIIDVAEEAGMTHEAVKRDLAPLEPFTVGTFSDFHGDKWNHSCDLIQALRVGIDQERIRKALQGFIETNRPALEAALEHYQVKPS